MHKKKPHMKEKVHEHSHEGHKGHDAHAAKEHKHKKGADKAKHSKKK